MSRLARREAIEGYIGISPWLIGFAIFMAFPILASLGLSFTNWRITVAPEWVGLRNYIRMFTTDPDFYQSLKVTFTYVAISLPLNLVVGLCLAMLLNAKVPALGFFRTLFYLPVVLSGVSVALMWMWLLNPDYGVVNTLLALIGIQGPQWFWHPNTALLSVALMSLWRVDTAWAMLAVIIVQVWKNVGYAVVIYLAGLQNVPPHLYEAAEMDGAGFWAKLFNVTLPMLTPTIFFQLVMELIEAFRVFTAVYVITNGGPVRSTLFYMFYMFRSAFVDFEMGYASALAWLISVIIMAFTLLVFKSSALWVYYESEGKG